MFQTDTSGIKAENKTKIIKTVEVTIPYELISKIMIDWNTVKTHGNYGALSALMKVLREIEGTNGQ